MRIAISQLNAIISVISTHMAKHKGELRLYGSRAKDNLKGGDIDLVLLLEQANVVSSLQLKKHYILAALKVAVDEQKVDLLIVEKN